MMWVHLIAIYFLIMSTRALTPIGEHVCQEEERYLVNVTQHFLRNATVRTYKWCMSIPPRCSTFTYRTLNESKIVEEQQIRYKPVCCEGYRPDASGEKCVPACNNCVNGDCNEDHKCYCHPGYRGDHCEKPCEFSRWGRYCRYHCTCERGTCNSRTGHCDCPNGWTGTRCETRCHGGYFGPQCKKHCECQDTESCDPTDGQCTLDDPDKDFKKQDKKIKQKTVSLYVLSGNVISSTGSTTTENPISHVVNTEAEFQENTSKSSESTTESSGPISHVVNTEAEFQENTSKSSESTTESSEPTSISSQSITKSSQSTTKSRQSTTKSSQSTTKSSQSTTKSSQSTTKSSQPTTKSSQSTTNSSESTTKSSVSTTKSSESIIKSSQSTKLGESIIKSSESTTKSSESTSKSSESTPKSSESTKLSETTTKLSTSTDYWSESPSITTKTLQSPTKSTTPGQTKSISSQESTKSSHTSTTKTIPPQTKTLLSQTSTTITISLPSTTRTISTTEEPIITLTTSTSTTKQAPIIRTYITNSTTKQESLKTTQKPINTTNSTTIKQEPIITSQEPMITNNIDSTIRQEPIITRNTNQEPIITRNTKQEPIITENTKQEPIITANTKQEPKITENTKQEPIITENTKQEPIITANTKQEPIIIGNNNQEQLIIKKPTTTKEIVDVNININSVDVTKRDALKGKAVGEVSGTRITSSPAETRSNGRGGEVLSNRGLVGLTTVIGAVALLVIAGGVYLALIRLRRGGEVECIGADGDKKLESTPVAAKSILRTPLPDPPTSKDYECTTFIMPSECKQRTETANAEAKVNTYTSNKDYLELFYDHPPSTGGYKSVMRREAPNLHTNTTTSHPQEPLYDEIPCWSNTNNDEDGNQLYINSVMEDTTRF